MVLFRAAAASPQAQTPLPSSVFLRGGSGAGRGAGPSPGTRSPPSAGDRAIPRVAQQSPVNSTQANGAQESSVSAFHPARDAWAESKAVGKARWRKTRQGVVHVAQGRKTRASCTNWSHWFRSGCCWPLLQQKDEPCAKPLTQTITVTQGKLRHRIGKVSHGDRETLPKEGLF